MRSTYRAKFRDEQGEIATSIENDGKSLRMVLCGVEFEGNDFDSFEVVPSSQSADLSRFNFAAGALCDCILDVEMPVTVMIDTIEMQAVLEAQLLLGRARTDGGIYDEKLCLALVVGDVRLASTGRSAWFEDELADIQRKLPSGWFLKVCFGCAFSDYSPYGHGLFGGLACFRDNKTGHRSVKTKIDLFRIWDTMTEFVQETYLCPDFERRHSPTGYRG